MVIKMIKKILIIFICFLLSGCYKYRDLNDLAIVSGIYISYNNNKYEAIVEVINTNKRQDSSSTDKEDSLLYYGDGDSIYSAINKVMKSSSKYLYTNHMKLLILDESVCKSNLSEVIDYFINNYKVRDEFYILIGKNKNILSISNSLAILDSLKLNANYFKDATIVSFQDFLSLYLNPYIDIAISSIDIDEDNKFYISNIGIFKDNKLVGYLSEEDSLIYNTIRAKNKNYYVNKTVDIKNKLINIYIRGNYSNNTIIEKDITNSIRNVISKYNSDIYGFEDTIYKLYPDYIKQVHNKWRNNILASFNVKVYLNIKNEGALYEEG